MKGAVVALALLVAMAGATSQRRGTSEPAFF